MSKSVKSGFYYFIKFYILFIFSLLTINFVLSADSYRLNVGDSEILINEHGVSRYAQVTSGSDVFVPTKTALEWQMFREHLPPHVFLRTYGSWSYNTAQKSCIRSRTVTQWTYEGGQITSSTTTQTEYARTSSTYARWNPSTGTRITGDAARWTSCRRCGWFNSLWCCDWEYCAINGGKSGSCTGGDNGSCCNWQASCDGCRNRCENSDKTNRYCSSNSVTC